MRSKLRVWLPTVQLAIAISLTTSNLLRQNRISNPSWIKPDKQICDGLNAPATLVRICLLKLSERLFTRVAWLDFIIETIVYLAFVALLWYFVSVEIGDRNHEKVSALTARLGPRTAVDLLLIAFGAALAVVGQLVRHQFGGTPDLYSNLLAIPYFMWAAVIAVFYGMDLCVFQSQKRKAVNS